MARRLYIYKGITPNINGNRYYYGSPTAFKTEISSFFCGSVSLDNYRIETDVAKITTSSLASFNVEPKEVTYLIVHDEAQQKYFKCYHVQSVEERDDYVIFRLSVDLWQTYISQASISELHITRCNRNIGEGVYDEIANAKPADVGTAINVQWLGSYTGAGWLTTDKRYAYEEYISVVFAVEYNVQQQVFGNDHISETGLYAIDFKTLRTLVNEQHANMAGVNIVSDIIGGIYGIGANWGGVLDARVINAWVLPNALFFKTALGHTFTSKSQYAGNASVSFVASQVLPRRKVEDFVNLPNNPNYALYFGTWNNGLKLQHYTTTNLRVKVYSIISQTSVQVIVAQGENQKDITSAFEITLTTNAGVTTGIRQVAKALSQAIGMGSGISKDLSKGDAMGAGLTAIKGVVDMIPLKPTIDGAIGGGDGGTTYYSTHAETIDDVKTYFTNNPFCATWYVSTIDEQRHARLYGAVFDVYNLNLTDLTTYSLLGSGSLTDTYLKASARLTGVPLEARAYILSNLENGIYLKIL